MQTVPLSWDASIGDGHDIRIQFGECCLGLTLHDDDISGKLKDFYRVFLSEQRADVNIDLNFVDRLDTAGVEAILRAQNIGTPEQRKAAGRLFDIRYDASGNSLAVKTERSIFDTSYKFKPMNRLLRLAYYTASRWRDLGRPANVLVHSCGILSNGRVSLFSGPSEIGKSTVGRLCPEDYGRTLNDEMVLLSWPEPGNRRIMARSVPIFGDLPFSLNVSAPLSRVFMLKQGQRIRARRLTRKEAYLRFMYQIVNPAYGGMADKQSIYLLIAEFADEVTRYTPFYELEFTRDSNLLWEVETSVVKLNGEEARRYGTAPEMG